MKRQMKVLIHFYVFLCYMYSDKYGTIRKKKKKKKKKNEPRHDKTNKMSVRPAKTQIDQSLRCALKWVAKDPRFLYADSEDSEQTWRMPRLI